MGDAGAEAVTQAAGTGVPKAGRRTTGAAFALLIVIQFMVVLDASVVNVALPVIQRDLHLDQSGLTWVVDAYLLTFGGFLLVGGRAADLVGRRRLFLGGLLLFTIASLACGLSTVGGELYAARAAQGIGAAFASPAALALLTDLYPQGPRRNRALGVWGSMGGFAGAAGVLLGGLLTALGWQWVFLVNVPVGLAAVIAGRRLVPAQPRPAPGSIGLAEAVSATAGVGLLIVALLRGSTHGWLDPTVGAAGLLCVALLGTFVVLQRRVAAPLLPRSVQQGMLLRANALNALVGMVLFGVFFIVTLELQQVLGFRPLVAGLLYVPVNLALLLGAQAAPRLIDRRGPAVVLAAGFVVQAAGLIWWAAVLGGRPVAVTFVAPTALWCIGLGMSVVAAFVLGTRNVPAGAAGAAAGLITTTLHVGGVIGLGVLASVVALRAGGTTATGQTVAAEAAGHRAAVLCAAGVCLAGAAITAMSRWRQQPPERVRSTIGEG